MSELIEIVARVLAERNGVRQWQVCAKNAAAALRAIEGAGYKVVGREATDKMVHAIDYAILTGAFDDDQRIWQAAFDAAPTVGGGE